MVKVMPVPNRTRRKDGAWRIKRSDAGIPRGQYGCSLVELEGSEEQVNNTLEEFKN